MSLARQFLAVSIYGNLTRGLEKFTLMHHYYANPLSVFSPFTGSPLSKETIMKMYENGHVTQDHAIHIRMLQSFRTYIESICESNPQEALQLLEDDEYLITDAVPRFLMDLDQYQKSFYVAFEIMTTVQACFPTFAGLRRSKRMLYLELLESKNGLVNSEFLKWLISLVRKMSVDSLEELLRGLCELVDGENYEASLFVFEENNAALNCKQKVQGWMERLGMKEIPEDESVDETHTATIVDEQLPDLDEGRQTKTAKRVKMYIITKKGGEPVKVSNEIADWLHDIFRYRHTDAIAKKKKKRTNEAVILICHNFDSQFLGSFTAKPLHEVIYYNSIKLHEKVKKKNNWHTI